MTQRDTLTFGESVVLQLINEVLPVAMTKRDIRESDGDLQTRCRQKAREIDAELSALTRERDEAREKVADQIVPGCASVTGDPVENAAEAHKRIEQERDEAEKALVLVREEAEAARLVRRPPSLQMSIQKNLERLALASRATDAANALAEPEVKHDN